MQNVLTNQSKAKQKKHNRKQKKTDISYIRNSNFLKTSLIISVATSFERRQTIMCS